MTSRARLLSFDLNPPPTPDALAAFLGRVGPVPDSAYFEFMQRHDGGEGTLGHSTFLVIWPLLESLANTESYRIGEIQEGLLLFATDGGDKGYAFDRSEPDWPVLTVSLSSASPEDINVYAKDFGEMLDRLDKEAR